VDSSVYDALHATAAVVDRSDRMRMTFTGDQAKTALGGLLTNDVTALGAGQGQRAAALTPKGRVIALLRVFDRGEDVLVDADGAAGPGFVAMIRKFVNPRLARYVDVTASTACTGVYGPQSAQLLARAIVEGDATSLTAALDALPEHGIHTHGTSDARVDIIRSADLGVVGFDCVASTARISTLHAALERAQLPRADAELVRIARIEAGIPEWGVEMNDETIPQEANLDTLGAISFSKGCYTGQEVVARIHFRGHVNRHLRWLSAPEPVPVNATITDAEGKELGSVRSSVVSPRRGPLAIAMVRREVASGSEVIVRADAREFPARCEEITR
jgi:folate-binding protein YgfZ